MPTHNNTNPGFISASLSRVFVVAQFSPKVAFSFFPPVLTLPLSLNASYLEYMQINAFYFPADTLHSSAIAISANGAVRTNRWDLRLLAYPSTLYALFNILNLGLYLIRELWVCEDGALFYPHTRFLLSFIERLLSLESRVCLFIPFIFQFELWISAPKYSPMCTWIFDIIFHHPLVGTSIRNLVPRLGIPFIFQYELWVIAPRYSPMCIWVFVINVAVSYFIVDPKVYIKHLLKSDALFWNCAVHIIF